MDKLSIMKAIEECVMNEKHKDYKLWYIGITNDPERRKGEHDGAGKNTKFWNHWRTDHENHATEIEKHFQDKGMKGDSGGSENPTHIYIY